MQSLFFLYKIGKEGKVRDAIDDNLEVWGREVPQVEIARKVWKTLDSFLESAGS